MGRRSEGVQEELLGFLAWLDGRTEWQGRARPVSLQTDWETLEPLQRQIRQRVLAFLLRAGGALPATVFINGVRHEGKRLWEAGVREHFRLALTPASLILLATVRNAVAAGKGTEHGAWSDSGFKVQDPGCGGVGSLLLESCPLNPESYPLNPAPQSLGDLVWWHVLAETLRRLEAERAILQAVLPAVIRSSPLTALARYDEAALEEAQQVQARWLLEDPLLLTYLQGYLVQQWLAAEGRREFWSLEEEQQINRRIETLGGFLFEAAREREAYSQLAFFIAFYRRLLRERGGFAGVIQAVRQKSRQCGSRQEQEAFERGYSEMFRWGRELTAVAQDLRERSWDLTDEGRYFLGLYHAQYEPVAEEIEALRRELRREV